MRIAVVTETFHPFKGGSAKRYLEVFKRIVEKGHEVDLFTARLNADWPSSEDIYGIRVHRTEEALADFITKDGFRSVRQVLKFAHWALSKLLKDEFDVVEANHCPIFPAMTSCIYSRLKSITLSTTFHEVWHSDWYHYVPRKIYAPIGMMLEGMTTKLPDVAIAVSNMTAQRLVTFFNMPRDKIRVISNGVDLKLFSNIECKRDRSKIIYIGRINPHKNLRWLLDAYKCVKQDYPDVSLEVVGDGPHRAQNEDYARRNGGKDISFLGQIEDAELAKCLKGAEIYVLPSVREGQSITTLEAMAAGTPQVVVETNSSGASNLLQSSGSGLAVKPSSAAIAAGIKFILEDRILWRRFHENGLKFIAEHSWDRVADDHLKLYESYLSK